MLEILKYMYFIFEMYCGRKRLTYNLTGKERLSLNDFECEQSKRECGTMLRIVPKTLKDCPNIVMRFFFSLIHYVKNKIRKSKSFQMKNNCNDKLLH